MLLPHSVSHLTSLRILDARLNCLRSLPDDLENLINLQILNVSQNFQYLETLPYSVGLLISLVELDVSYNKIKTLPDSIGCLKKLQKLSVEGNPLVSPPMEVVEQSLQAVKEYLSQKMNGVHTGPPKKKSWFGKLVKCATFNGAMMNDSRDRDSFPMSHYRSIDGLASPRYMGMFSPRRLFSPRRHSNPMTWSYSKNVRSHLWWVPDTFTVPDWWVNDFFSFLFGFTVPPITWEFETWSEIDFVYNIYRVVVSSLHGVVVYIRCHLILCYSLYISVTSYDLFAIGCLIIITALSTIYKWKFVNRGSWSLEFKNQTLCFFYLEVWN